MTIVKILLLGLAMAANPSCAAIVNFTAAEGYVPGPITEHPDWGGSGVEGLSVDPSGTGSLSIDDNVSQKQVFYQKGLDARSDIFTVSIKFSFKRWPAIRLAGHRNLISVELNYENTSSSSLVALRLQRVKSNPQVYRLMVMKKSTDDLEYFSSGRFGEMLMGFDHVTDVESDVLELRMKLNRAVNAFNTWNTSCTIQNTKTAEMFEFETPAYEMDSEYFSNELYPAIGIYGNEVESSVFSKVVQSFRYTSRMEKKPAPKPPMRPLTKPNVLFLVVDDLNDWTGLWRGHPNALTPNLDRLARMGLRFTNAHCAVPACNPSRVSVLSGMRAATTGLYLNEQKWNETPRLIDAVSLPQRFRDNGYYTARIGKVFHHDIPESWNVSTKAIRPGPPLSWRPLNGLDVPRTTNFDWGPYDIPENRFADWVAADETIDRMREYREEPFFLACGFHWPHLPWYPPTKYFDRFPIEEIELPVVNENDLDDIPIIGQKMARWLNDHKTVTDKPGAWKEGVQAYLAATAFIDDCIGRILDAYDEHPEKENTIIVLWTDHGWHLGEKLHWRKFSLWEEATRVPLTFTVPGLTTPNSASDAPVSLLDIYPTLLELAGLPADANADGNSLLPLLRDWKSKWPHEAITEHGYMNRAVRTWRWRYILYSDGSEELYDHSNDPNEWTNLANVVGYEATKAMLRRRLPQTYARPT